MRGRHPILLTVLLVAVVLVAAPAAQAQRQHRSAMAIAPGDPAPQLIGWGDDGSLVKLAYDGRYTLVNFWATWCEPCRQEMPALQKMQDSLGEKGLQIVGFNQEPEITREQFLTFLEEAGVTYPNLRPDHRWSWGMIGTVPTSFLVGPDGRIMRKYVGAAPEQIEGLERDLDDAVNGRPLKAMVLPKPKPAE